MKMKKPLIYTLILVSLILISGCAQQHEASCPSSCYDNNSCTNDKCSAQTNFTCVYETITPCCGNNICERDGGETHSSCPSECELTGAEKTKLNSVIAANMIKQYDEFEKITWYWYKPLNGDNDNGLSIHLYFAKYDNTVNPSNLRLKIEYRGRDWIFINKYWFSIDGESSEYIPYDVKREVRSNGGILEWSDESINTENCEIIKEIITSESAKIKFEGDTKENTATITPMQKYAMKNVLYVYKGLSGSLPDCLKDMDMDNNFVDTKFAVIDKECITAEDCKYSKICSNYKCVECMSNTDCTDNNYPLCNNGMCIKCISDNDCINWGWYSESAGQKTYLKKCKQSSLGNKYNSCVECASDSDCENKKACSSNSCVTVECKTNSDCSTDKPYCDTSIGYYYHRCVECLTNNQCLSTENCVKWGFCTCSLVGLFCVQD